MNYRHAFHAGNFADVFKHIVLTRILTYLNLKDAPYRVIDTHAGLGRYKLTSDEARRTGEAQRGVFRFAKARFAADVEALLAPYRTLIAPAIDADGYYPGSPEIAARLTRPQDRLTLSELHPRDAMKLRNHFYTDARIAILERDGYQILKASTPPNERRGLVLIDPPFEEGDEFLSLRAALAEAYRKWPTGIYALWYPIKPDGIAQNFLAAIAASGMPKLLALELMIDSRNDALGLPGCGLLIVNPPFVLADEMQHCLAALVKCLAPEHGSFRVATLT